jgi:hypothetical protein
MRELQNESEGHGGLRHLFYHLHAEQHNLLSRIGRDRDVSAATFRGELCVKFFRNLQQTDKILREYKVN